MSCFWICFEKKKPIVSHHFAAEASVNAAFLQAQRGTDLSPGSRLQVSPVSPDPRSVGHPPLRRPGIAKGFFGFPILKYECVFLTNDVHLADLGENMDRFFKEKMIKSPLWWSPRFAGACACTCAESWGTFFPESSLLLKLQRNPVKPCAPGCWRGPAGKMKEVILMVQKNYTIHMNLGNLAILWQGRCLHLGNPKISCCPKSRMKTDPKHDGWHFGILTCLIWAQELCWDPVSSKEGHHNLQSKLKCTIQIHSSCTLLTYACR